MKFTTFAKDDFSREIGWVLYSNLDRLPRYVDMESYNPFADVPAEVFDALEWDWDNPDDHHIAADIVSHYNLLMFFLTERLAEIANTAKYN